jgi:hypothetical protein
MQYCTDKKLVLFIKKFDKKSKSLGFNFFQPLEFLNAACRMVYFREFHMRSMEGIPSSQFQGFLARHVPGSERAAMAVS